METGKPGLASAPVHMSSITAQTEKRMDIQAPMPAVYIQTVPALPVQPYFQPPAGAREPAALHLPMPPLYSKNTLPFLTLHIVDGLQSQAGLNQAIAAPAARSKSAGKHVCPHCGRDCMKPSVLEKHLRCHTGERPYPCNTCGVSFKTQSNLYKHKRTQAHARLSYESEQNSLGSLDSMSSSRDTCTSSLSLEECSKESGSIEKDASLQAAESSCSVTSEVYTVKMRGPTSEQKEPKQTEETTKDKEKQTMESEKYPPTVTQKLPLQRQGAALFSKQWESSVCRGKSQSYESTDSGFSESSDLYPSPGSIIPDHSMDSLAECTKEHPEETISTHAHLKEGPGIQELKDSAREQEQKILAERISKLISENTAVVEDKQLENVRPRKTVLSKQGSIDLPMPYTYKDSFHFDMRISKALNVGLHKNKNPGLYRSEPTQHSNTVEHAPLTRSNSLPFSVTLQSEGSSPASPYLSDNVTFERRGSSGQINPTGFAMKPVNQQSSTHRPLVRQTAVDCNHATEALFMNSSVEEACTSSLSFDGDGSDICGEPSNRKFRRKKAQKFSYNKWYMYRGGTFKKLYKSEKVCDGGVVKGRKSSTNAEHEVVQGLQKRLSVVYKEPTTTCSTINSISATACRPSYPPTKLCGVDFNQKTVQLPSSSCSLKTLQRNQSLSTLTLASTGSLVTQKTENMNRAEEMRLINEEKQTDSTSQLSGAHIPSDRKKQKTDDRVSCSVDLKTDTNTLTHPRLTVSGCVPQQNNNLSYVNFQANQKHTQLKGALFSPCIFGANAPTLSTSAVASIPSAAKTSFLPKYQLKLPNAAESDSNAALHVVDKPTETDSRSCSLSSSDHTPSFISTSECSTDPATSSLMQTLAIKERNYFSNFKGQVLLPCAVTTVCQAETSRHYVTSNLAVVHRPFAGTTKTTTCLHDNQAGLCSTSVQSLISKPSVGSPPMELPTPGARTTTTENKQTPAAALTAFSQGKPSFLPHTHSSVASGRSDLVHRPDNPGSGSSILPYHIVPFDVAQPAGQKVFHVHTPDLQICLQIISDEQLALIEPQIERHAGGSLSQRHDEEQVLSEVTQNKDHNSLTMNNTNEGRNPEQPGHPNELDQNTERINPPLSVQLEKEQPKLRMAGCSDSTEATESAECKSSEATGLPLQSHKLSHVNTASDTPSCTCIMSTAASLADVKPRVNQASEKERFVEDQLSPYRRGGQLGLVPQMLPVQHKLIRTAPSPVNQNSTRSELLFKESQHKRINQGSSCNVGSMKSKDRAPAQESGTTCPHLQVGLGPAFRATYADEPSWTTFPKNKCKVTKQVNQQVSNYSSNPGKSASLETLDSSTHANMGCDKFGALDNSALSQEVTPSQDVMSSACSEQQPDRFTAMSSNVRLEGAEDMPAVPANTPRHSAELLEGASPMGCPAQKVPQTGAHGGTPGQPDSTGWRSKQSQEARETNHQCVEGQGRGVVVGEDDLAGMRSIKLEVVQGQWGKDSSYCRHLVSPETTVAGGEDKQVKGESCKNSRLTEKHLSQMQSGMSEQPPQSPQQSPNTSKELHLLGRRRQTSLLHSPQHPLELINLFSSGQQHIPHNEQTHICEPKSSQPMKAETQHANSQIEPRAQQTQTFSNKDSRSCLSYQQGNTCGGHNNAAACCCYKSALGSHKCTELSSDVRTTSSPQPSQASPSFQVSKVSAGLSEEDQTNSKVLDDSNEQAAHGYTSQSQNAGRADVTNKSQSFVLAGLLHSSPTAEGLSSEVRPGQSCQDYTEDTSSSDDEGKLIIEL